MNLLKLIFTLLGFVVLFLPATIKIIYIVLGIIIIKVGDKREKVQKL